MLKDGNLTTYPVPSHKLLTGVQDAINQVYEDATFHPNPEAIPQSYEPMDVFEDPSLTVLMFEDDPKN
jgi:hypothetical protein